MWFNIQLKIRIPARSVPSEAVYPKGWTTSNPFLNSSYNDISTLTSDLKTFNLPKPCSGNFKASILEEIAFMTKPHLPRLCLKMNHLSNRASIIHHCSPHFSPGLVIFGYPFFLLNSSFSVSIPETAHLHLILFINGVLFTSLADRRMLGYHQSCGGQLPIHLDLLFSPLCTCVCQLQFVPSVQAQQKVVSVSITPVEKKLV